MVLCKCPQACLQGEKGFEGEDSSLTEKCSWKSQGDRRDLIVISRVPDLSLRLRLSLERLAHVGTGLDTGDSGDAQHCASINGAHKLRFK